jgi:hypothetical protein
MMGALCGFTRQRWRPTRPTAGAPRARLPDRADASDGRLDSRLARARARAMRSTSVPSDPPGRRASKGGRGFNSLAEAALLPPASSRADFLFFGRSFELFFDYRLFKRTARKMGLEFIWKCARTGTRPSRNPGFVFLFASRAVGVLCPRNRREIQGRGDG